MTTPSDQDSVTERFDPIPPAVQPPTFTPAAPEPGAVPGTTESVPTEPVGMGGVSAGHGIAASTKPPRSASPTLLNIALAVGILIAVAGVAYSIGRTTASAGNAGAATGGTGPLAGGAGPFAGGGPGSSFDLDGDGGRGLPGNGRGMFGVGGLGITGTVQSVTADSITIRTADGRLVTVGTDAATAYHQQTDASASDVKAGTTVIVGLAGGGFGPGMMNGNGANGSITLGTAGDITVVP